MADLNKAIGAGFEARYKKLVAEDSIASQQLDTQAALVRQYQGQVVTDQATKWPKPPRGGELR